MNINEKIIFKIKNKYPEKRVFRRIELYQFIKENISPELKESTFKWRLHLLKKANLLISIKRGVFEIAQKKSYKPYIDNKIKRIANLVTKEFYEISYCIWNSNWFNQFSTHQANSNIVFIETEKELVMPVFYLLNDKGYKNIYIDPDKIIMETYLLENTESIIIKTMISKSPVQLLQKIKIPKIEKIMVDLISNNKNHLVTYQGMELITIYKNMLDDITINFSTLISYSKRRRKEKIIKKILIEDLGIKKEVIL